ncbi:MAG: serine/threonine-protein kinase [Gammaproteobacteria bacterium]
MIERNAQALKPSARVGQFEIHDILGCGAYGITYKAQDRALERPAAIKEYFPNGLAAREEDRFTLKAVSGAQCEAFEFGLKNFMLEARALARFNEPSIVRVQQYVETNGTGYLAMNYEDGRTLSYVLRRALRLNEQQARAVAVHILRGLRALHAQNFLHQDIKPGNILVRRSGPPVLLDFGAARQALERAVRGNASAHHDIELTDTIPRRDGTPMLLDAGAARRALREGRTGAPALMFTPGYAPIEQYSSDEERGPWTDLYGLGATLYHCILGKSPAPAQDRVIAHGEGRPDAVKAGLDQLSSAYGYELRESIEWMLQPRPGDRPRQAQDVLNILMPAAGETAATIRAPARPKRNTRSQSQAPAQPETATFALEPTVLDTVRKQLANLLGPIAPMLIKHTMARCSSEAELFEALALELDVPEERDAFLAACSAAARSVRGDT